jgi:hypothetical protein
MWSELAGIIRYCDAADALGARRRGQWRVAVVASQVEHVSITVV